MRSLALVVVAACAAPAAPKVAPPSAPPPVPVPVATPLPDPPPPAFRLPGDVRPVALRARAHDRARPPNARRARSTSTPTVVRPTRVVWLNAHRARDRGRAKLGGARRARDRGRRRLRRARRRSRAAARPARDRRRVRRADRSRARAAASTPSARATTPTSTRSSSRSTRAARSRASTSPRYKVPWQLTFHVRRDDVALGNAPVARETDEPDGMKRVELAESRPLPSYLVAFVVGPFEVDRRRHRRAARNTPIRVRRAQGPRRRARLREGRSRRRWSPRSRTTSTWLPVRQARRRGGAALLGHDGAPRHRRDGPAAHADPRRAGDAASASSATRTSSRTSCRTTGSATTSRWRGGTTPGSTRRSASGRDMNITDAVEPAWRYRDERVGIATAAMTRRRGARDPRRSAARSTTREADRGVVRQRHHLLQGLVGAAHVRGGRRARPRGATSSAATSRKHAWGNATADDFVGDLRAQLGGQVADMLATYLARPGLPRVEVALRTARAPRSSSSTQSRRALPPGVVEASDDQNVWSVPVCVRYGDATHSERACGTSAPRRSSAKVCPTWIIPNAEATGYYRSIVEPELVAALFDAALGDRARRQAVDRGEA